MSAECGVRTTCGSGWLKPTFVCRHFTKLRVASRKTRKAAKKEIFNAEIANDAEKSWVRSAELNAGTAKDEESQSPLR